MKGSAILATVPPALDDQLVSPAFYQDPYPFYEQLSAQARVAWSEALCGWLIPRYDDVLATMLDTQHFSSQGRVLAVLDHLPAGLRANFRPFENHFTGGLINADPPNHTRLRALVNKAFTPRTVEQLRPRIQGLVNEMLDAVQSRGKMDLVHDLAYPLPAIVIAEILGAPPETREDFQVWSDGILAFQGSGVVSPEVLEQSQQHLLAMRAFLTELLAERRRQPRDDLLSHLAEAEMEGDRLTPAELLTTCVTLLIAGHETTTNLIASGLYTLLRHPEQMRQLRADPALMPSAVEEMLRFESPLQRNPRRVAEDFEYGGAQLRRGDYVLQMLGAANRDPKVFPNPGQFDITRQPNRHLAFAFGIHFCVGAPLARLEAPIAIGTVLRRLPRLRLAAETIEWEPHGLLRGLGALPVAF
ncbi:MAG: cytochrome P450 [Anaerolineales bacterium]